MKLNSLSIALLIALLLVIGGAVFLIIRSESKADSYKKHALVGIIQSKVAARNEIKSKERKIDSLILVQQAADVAIHKYLQEVEKSYKVDSQIQKKYEKELNAIFSMSGDELLRYVTDRHGKNSH